MILSQYVAKNQAHWEIPNGSKSLISSFFTLCSKTLAFEQCWPWSLLLIFYEREEMKQRIFLHKYLQICNLKGFQAIRQKVTWFSKYEKTCLNPFANWSFNCRWKKSVSFFNKEFHFLFLDTNRQYKSYEKFWSHDFFLLVLSPETLQGNLVNYFLQLWFMCLLTQKPTVYNLQKLIYAR